ncbi:MAG TPA: VTT domain-containing protein [Solimonas sp.]|nr:VTT domain-containing protein [Solimonas sp.]
MPGSPPERAATVRPAAPPVAAAARQRAKLLGLAATVVLLALAAAWRFTPLHHYADAEAIAGALHGLQRSPWAIFAIVGIYVAANAVLFPNTILNVATILGLGTAFGLPCALAGSLTAAMAFYWVGRRYGRSQVRYLASPDLDRLGERIKASGVLGMAGIRLLPIAPFTVVNVLAGALRVRPWVFGAGTFLGLLPGNLLVTAFGHQLREALAHPSKTEIAMLAGILLIAGAGLWYLRGRALRA